jgi:mannose-6-phosphate isomerase-like protein (cupin superfamily)
MDELPPRNAELRGYVYVPRMLAKARNTLAGTNDGYAFGCPLDHTCMARLGTTPETVIELVTRYGDDDQRVLAELESAGIPPADAIRFDAEATEHELMAGTYLQVRSRERIGELELRPGDQVLTVEAGEAKISLGDRQQRIVRAGEIVRIPPDMPHRIESVGDVPLRTTRQAPAAEPA